MNIFYETLFGFFSLSTPRLTPGITLDLRKYRDFGVIEGLSQNLSQWFNFFSPVWQVAQGQGGFERKAPGLRGMRANHLAKGHMINGVLWQDCHCHSSTNGQNEKTQWCFSRILKKHLPFPEPPSPRIGCRLDICYLQRLNIPQANVCLFPVECFAVATASLFGYPHASRAQS